MSINKMLIDAAHAEETRVSVLRDGRIEEFDFESATRRPLRGNIYLAKVTRVEPSLQAAFVDYGGNRHGFLAFSEIHPDYYQIPIADREALLEQEAEDARAASAAEAARDEQEDDDNDEDDAPAEPVSDLSTDADEEDDGGDDSNDSEQSPAMAADAAADPTRTEEVAPQADDDTEEASAATSASTASDETDDTGEDGDADAQAAGVEELEDVPVRKRRPRKQYRIQEVIKRRQIILIQVVKEERGNKGAALTTYLSLAGRHTVLMPNTARGGGISRKITNPADRKRLRTIANDLEVPEGTGLIIRTAGASRTKAEIKRDFEYLMRLWENVRDLTLKSTSPALVYEEGNLIKRSIRDLYSKEIDEVLVAGEDAYREAKDFMRMIMPSHAKNVKRHDDAEPLFAKYRIERNLNEMFSPTVTLPSGGYIVVNQTEALVAIDVNSGKSTRQSSIEETALSTNMEAAEEIARQLKLRDLAGLIVIDFIDMDERRNNRNVEKKMKDCLRHDRARIQVGRISHFGLMEMSRQRLRPGVLEGSTSPCAHCQGTGMIRSTNSVALSVIRSLEDALMAGEATNLTAETSVEVALYILNEKRDEIIEMEQRYSVSLQIVGSVHVQGANYKIERASGAGGTVMQMDWGNQEPGTAQQGRSNSSRNNARRSNSEDEGARKPRRRRRRRRDEEDDSEEANVEEANASEASADSDDEDENGEPRKRRRRGRRGGRRNRRRDGDENVEAREDGEENSSENEQSAEAAEASDPDDEEGSEAKSPRRRRSRGGRGRGRGRKAAEATEDSDGESAEVSDQPQDGVDAQDGATASVDEEAAVKETPVTEAAPTSNGTKRHAVPSNGDAGDGDTGNGHAPRKSAGESASDDAAPITASPAPQETIEDSAPEQPPAPQEPPKPARRGWWQRK